MAIRIQACEDGSNTLYDDVLDETFHSVKGALGESLHVFILNGLNYVSENKKEIELLEVGFGTGLNALLSMDHRQDTRINYSAIEPNVLNTGTFENYYRTFSNAPQGLHLLGSMITEDTEDLKEIQNGFNFRLIRKSLENMNGKEWGKVLFDLVYYDAFSPTKQPEMWSFEMLSKVAERMKPGGVLVTYCAQGAFKRHLKRLGFLVENPEGALGKRQMTRAIKQEGIKS